MMQELAQMTKEERLERMRHSAAHIMAEAVCEMFPEPASASARPSTPASTTTSTSRVR